MLINYQGQYYSCTVTDSISHVPIEVQDTLNGRDYIFFMMLGYILITGFTFLFKIITFKK